MQAEIDLNRADLMTRVISPFCEMGAYEVLWTKPKTTFKKLAEMFSSNSGCTPSDFVSLDDAVEYAKCVKRKFSEAEVEKFGVRVHGAGEYPQKLRDATYPVELLYFQGWWSLVFSRSVAVIGTRKPSKSGLARTRQVVRELVQNDITVVSGLASGIDTMAHETAIKEEGRTIAVLGTPLSYVYPRANATLQRNLAENHLIISQVPLKRYENQDYRFNRFFFPERNITMSALTDATIIIEAGESSGTLMQARAAIKQNRKLFILDSCFKNQNLSWPKKFEEKGAFRVRNFDEIAIQLAK